MFHFCSKVCVSRVLHACTGTPLSCYTLLGLFDFMFASGVVQIYPAAADLEMLKGCHRAAIVKLRI